jgi:glycerophosphoryl diester phosphodiesterase
MAGPDPGVTRPLRLSHRGDWRQATENTIAAFLAAMAIPACDGLELDVRLSADGVPIVIHDATLTRVQGQPARADQVSAAALEDLGVPSLAAVLEAVPRRAFLDVELKDDPGRAIVEVLAAGRGAELHRAIVSTFDRDVLERIGGLAPTWPRWLNADDLEPSTIAAAVELGCRAIAAHWRAIDPGSAARVRAAGLELAAWTVRRRASYERLARLGVVAVCVEAAALDG